MEAAECGASEGRGSGDGGDDAATYIRTCGLGLVAGAEPSSAMEGSQNSEGQQTQLGNDSGEEESAKEEGCATEAATPHISKKQLKRERRKEAFTALKKFKKEKKKEAKREQRSLHLASTSDSHEPSPSRAHRASSETGSDAPEEGVALTMRKQAKKAQFLQSCANNFHIIIDCDWENEHSDSALASLTQQIMFCYGINRRSENPATIFLSNLGPRATANLDKVNFRNWAGASTSTDDYISQPQYSVEAKEGCKQLVYLSSDATEVLHTIDRNCAYIIGGIVDRNRLKGVTHQKAVAQGLRTVKLPIQQYFSLKATPVLAVNHVFDILLQVAAHGDWVHALSNALPKRKEPTQKTDSANSCVEKGSQGEESDDNEEEEEGEEGEENENGTGDV